MYEQTITLGRKEEKIKYDFFLPVNDIYIEYWGLEGASGDLGKQYIERKEEKLKIYKKYDLKLLCLYPSDLDNLENAVLEGIQEVERSYRSIWKRIAIYLKYALFTASRPEPELTVPSNTDHHCTNCGNLLLGVEDFCVNCGQKNE